MQERSRTRCEKYYQIQDKLEFTHRVNVSVSSFAGDNGIPQVGPEISIKKKQSLMQSPSSNWDAG